MIVVSGATGHVGAEAARLLAADGHQLRLLVRDPSRAPNLTGAEISVADFADGEALRGVLSAGDRVFMVSVDTEPDERVDVQRRFIEAAAEAGVAQLVYLSFLGASLDSSFVHARSHRVTEELIRMARVPFTFLRTSLYVNTILDALESDDGVMRGPGRDGHVSWVAREDCAAAVAAVLSQEGHVGRTYDVTGPEAPSLSETMEIVSSTCGCRMPYEEESFDRAIERRLAAGVPDWYARGWAGMYHAVARGEQAVVSDAVERLCGRSPIGVAEWAAGAREQIIATTQAASS